MSATFANNWLLFIVNHARPYGNIAIPVNIEVNLFHYDDAIWHKKRTKYREIFNIIVNILMFIDI